MGRRSLAIWVVCLMVVVGGRAAAETDNPVRAIAYCIMDADTGTILSAQNHQMMLPPASTLKVGTALVAINTLQLQDKVPVSVNAAQAPASKIYLKPGEIYNVNDMLYAILLASANDAARALGERVSGSEDRFARFMTKQLREMGAYRTNFETASGLPSEGQYSTAYDLAFIFRKAMQNPTLARIMNTKTYTLQDGKEVYNHNRFLFTTEYAVAGKTGYTRASKHTYVGLFRNGDKRIIVSMMGSQGKWADLRTLIEKGFAECGAPVAKLPPVEESLRRPGTYARASAKSRTRKYVKGKTPKRKVLSAGVVSATGTQTSIKKKYSSGSYQKKKIGKSKVKTSTRCVGDTRS